MISPYASQACFPCRRLKRKCTRELPTCSLCARLSKPCGYQPKARRIQSTNIINSKLPIQSGEKLQKRLENGISGNSWNTGEPNNLKEAVGLRPAFGDIPRAEFPSLFFLDSESHPARSLDRQPPGRLVPSKIMGILGPITALHASCGVYLETIHTWLPILSQKRLYKEVNQFNADTDVGIALLLLCMKLVSEIPLEGEDAGESALYCTTKEFYSKIENSCLLSLRLLQSAVLISVYEIGHGIYPGAYLSVSHAARLGLMIGLHDKKNATQLFKEPDSWSTCEEERRTWWAIVILDRYLNLGISRIPLATPEPLHGTLLPCTEASWDHGEVSSNEPLFASSFAISTNIGCFATACQACHMLGLVLRHRDSYHACDMDPHFRLPEALKLHEALVSLNLHLAQKKRHDYLARDGLDSNLEMATALCFSARIILYNMYACNEHYSSNQPRIAEESEMQQASIRGLKEITKDVYHLSMTTMKGDPLSKSPILFHCLYEAAMELGWFIQEEENMEGLIAFKNIVELIKSFGQRWRVAKQYLKGLDIKGYLTYLQE